MYKFHTDPGHGWLAVPVAELYDLGIAQKISRYSYISRDGRLAYLEEDCDLSIFARTKFAGQTGQPIRNFFFHSVQTVDYTEDCFVRFLPRFPAHTNHSAATFAVGAL